MNFAYIVGCVIKQNPSAARGECKHISDLIFLYVTVIGVVNTSVIACLVYW